ncbi:8345_t:CDS:10 [Funneliformis caledonium]|uniref:8345_t:CDS:1 n=1 Tax=Funneliformis caledonium TaxID=1117310 RepID=A0A9N8V6Z2_9GLOM|nr:8345_t:CDS:10 [Funneliformis caledonium]
MEDKPHNGKPITMMEVSPNAKYIVTYSEEDQTIVWWDAGIEKGKLEPIKPAEREQFHILRIEDEEEKIVQMCISDNKELVYSKLEYGSYIYYDSKIDIHKYLKFILYGKIDHPSRSNIIWIYSTQTKSNKWICQNVYEVPKEAELVSISKYDKIWLRINSRIYEWDIVTEEYIPEYLSNIPILFHEFHMFVIMEGHVWKIKFDELKFDELKFDINFLLEENTDDYYNDEFTEGWKAYFGNEADSEYPFIPDLNINTSKLFKQVPEKYNLGNIRLEIYIGIRVYKKSNEWDLIYIGIFIFHLNTHYQLILDHFQHIIRYVNKKYVGMDDENFPIEGWISYVKNDKKRFLKYGVEFLKFNIKKHDLKLIKCLNYFKDYLESNKLFLSIITTNMPLLSKYYPEYITRYSLDTNMIIDSPDYKIEYIITSQLFPFSWLSEVFSNIQFCFYPHDDIWWVELISPQPSPFVETITENIYKTWNGEALINFKWNSYGKLYYSMIWMGFIALLGCFSIAATSESKDGRNILLIASAILGFIHLTFEIRQFIYNPIRWIHDYWNIFDITAYFLTIYASISWLKTDYRNVPLLSFTCQFLDFKFLLFFRAFEYFGVYFAIIIGVAKRIISFLMVLLIILISFAHAFYILLSLDDPWEITTSYTDNYGNPYLIQKPDENTNMFSQYKTALFAMFLFLTGDSSALTHWPYKENSTLVVLMAKVLAEIELFYLLPNQRRWKSWFPDVIYYYADVKETHRKVNELIKDGEWKADEFPEMKNNLLKLLNIHNPEYI